MHTSRQNFRIWGGFITTQALALAVLAAPLLAGNERNYTYLALGDSIAFGMDPTLFIPPLPTPTPAQFTGYPEVVARVEHLLQSKKEVNAACPGETSGSFWIAGAPDNGCNGLGPAGQPPFKTSIGLHTNYTGTQLGFAVSQLTINKHINLVTLGIGGNDLLLLEQQCSAPGVPSFSACVSALLPGVLQSYAANLTAILASLRAKYNGTVVLVTIYSPSSDPLFTQTVAALNSAMMQVGSQAGAKFADGFTAFQLASASTHGDPCQAGLLIHLSATTCDVHPSPLGRDLLAAAVLSAIGDSDFNSDNNNNDDDH
jgi:lysophospholipase L1-like esterase